MSSVDLLANAVGFAGAPAAAEMQGGHVKWVDGPLAGVTMQVIDALGSALVLDRPLVEGIAPGQLAYLREGCDHTVATCATRFGNAVNFRGEPHLPGNDLLARYPSSSG